MEKALNLCKWQRKLMKLIGLAGVAFVMLVVGLLIADAVSVKDLSLLVVRITFIVVIPEFGLAGVYLIIRVKARKAVFEELNFLLEDYFESNNYSVKVQGISSNEDDYMHTYYISLTRPFDIDMCQDLIMKLINLKSGVSYALRKHVQIYCNNVWVC